MDILDDLTKASLRQETVVTIGAFDGVHVGHQALIGQVVRRARTTDRLAALITFHPHPAVVLVPERAPRYLTTPGEKLALLQKLDLDLVVLLPFDLRMAATPAGEFMAGVSRHLRLRELWVGPDFALGRGRQGGVSQLRELGVSLNFEVHVVQPIALPSGGDSPVSSSRIRALLNEGRVDQVAQMLGRYPSVSGEVVPGVHRGRSLGFPTANLEIRPERALPANGVYAVYALLGEVRYPAVANVGVRPSFDNGERTIETHILDFDEDIYGCDLVVEFVVRLRDERRFAKIDSLVAQIGRDRERARRILCSDQFSTVQTTSAEALDGAPPSTACPYRYQEVEHTADRALCVWGRDQADLFVGAAQGMYHLMADLNGVVGTQWRTVAVEAPDRESLLVHWLNELLFLTDMEGLLFAEHQIEELSDTSLVARIGGVVAEVTKAHIKAATYHDLSLVEDEAGWSATITFDV